MIGKELEIVRGSGNAFRDLNHGNPDLLQLKALLAAEIIKRLDKDRLTVRKAQEITGVAAADFSRIRSATLDRFTADRLMDIIYRLGARVDVTLKIRPGRKARIPA